MPSSEIFVYSVLQSLIEIAAAKFVREFGDDESSQAFQKLSPKIQDYIKEYSFI